MSVVMNSLEPYQDAYYEMRPKIFGTRESVVSNQIFYEEQNLKLENR